MLEGWQADLWIGFTGLKLVQVHKTSHKFIGILAPSILCCQLYAMFIPLLVLWREFRKLQNTVLLKLVWKVKSYTQPFPPLNILLPSRSPRRKCCVVVITILSKFPQTLKLYTQALQPKYLLRSLKTGCWLSSDWLMTCGFSENIQQWSAVTNFAILNISGLLRLKDDTSESRYVSLFVWLCVTGGTHSPARCAGMTVVFVAVLHM